jgi:hypothetical protein
VRPRCPGDPEGIHFYRTNVDQASRERIPTDSCVLCGLRYDYNGPEAIEEKEDDEFSF